MSKKQSRAGTTDKWPFQHLELCYQPERALENISAQIRRLPLKAEGGTNNSRTDELVKSWRTKAVCGAAGCR